MAVEAADAGAVASANNTATPTVDTTTAAPAATDVAAKAEPAKSANPWNNVDSELMKVWAKNNPNRYVDGKFAPKEQPAEQPAASEQAAVATTEQPNPADQPKDTKVEQAKPAIDPPLSWSAEAKAKWAALPPELQTYLTQRDKESHTAISQQGQKLKTYEASLKAYEPFEKVVTANQNLFKSLGITADAAFAEAVNLYNAMEQDAIGTLVHLGLRKGIDLRPAFQGMSAVPTQHDPRFQQLEARNRQLEERLVAFETRASERDAAEQQAADQKVVTEIDTFKTEKDKDGKLLRPYFDEPGIQKKMAVLLANGEAETLGDAYDQAIHATPTLRQRILEDQRKAEEAKRTAEAKAKATEAIKSNSVNVRSAPAAANPKTMDDDLHAIAAKHYPGYRRSA